MADRDHIVARGVLKGKITRITNYIQAIQDEDHFEISEIMVRGKELDKLSERYDKIQTQIEMLETDKEKAAEHEAERTAVETKCYSTKAAIYRLLNQHNSSVNEDNNHTKSGKTLQIRLPKLELPHFSGDMQEWTTFKNVFECAMDGSEIPTLQRLQYLKSSLRGEAAGLVSSLLITEENYNKAFDILKNRYENQTMVVNFHMKNFMNYTTITKQNLKHFVTTLQQSLDSLTALDLPVDKWDVLLVYIITQKLDNSLRASWELNRKESSIPKMTELKEFLSLRVTALELMNDKYVEKGLQPFKSNTKFSHVSTSYNNESQCTMCQGQHYLSKCPNFLELSIDKRIDYIKTNTLCYNCLQPYSFKHKCSKRNCSTCHGRHHSLIHLSNPPRKVTPTTGTYNTVLQSTHTQDNYTHTQDNNAHIQDNNMHIQGNNHTYIPNNTAYSQNNNNEHKQVSYNLNNIPTHTGTATCIPNNIPIIQGNTTNAYYAQLQPHILHNKPQTTNLNTNEKLQTIYTTPSSVCMSNTNKNQILLSTAVIKVQDSIGNWQTARALLDSGSEVSIVTHRLATRLNSKLYYDNHIIQGIGVTGKQTQLCINTNIASRLSDYNVNQSFIVMDKITVPLPHNQININTLNIPKQQQKLLADPGFYIPGDIDMLVGAELFYSLLTSNIISLGPNRPQLIESVFGWIVSGSIPIDTHKTSNHISLHLTCQQTTDDLLTKFWQQEEIKPKNMLKPEHKYCDELFLDTTIQEDSGHFCVEMPMQNERIQELGDSFNIAYKHLLILESKFEKDPIFYQQYKEFIDEFIQLGHAEYVPNFQHQQNFPHCYLPHMGVLKPDSRSTKLRTVFNASSKTSTGISLNDILSEGPNIYNDVLDILLRFRMYKFAFSCDIIKMFRAIFVQEKQRPFLRILWRNSKSQPLQCIQLKTVVYGTKCAPFLACRTVRHLANLYQQEFSKAAEIVHSECYMDDFLSGGDTIEEAQNICIQLTQLLEIGKFKLHKWSTNEPKVLQHILHKDHNPSNTSYEFTPNDTIKTLGIEWVPHWDSLSIAVPKSKDIKLTKRNILSVLAQIYDPIGILAPTTIIAKIMMQDIWKLKLDWDSVLPEELQKTWTEFYHNIPYLQNLSIYRYYFTDVPSEIYLLGFSDASQKAYGACLYLRATYPNRTPSCALVIAKTKVAPIKTQSLPRLELCGALLLAQLVNRLLEVFKNKFTINKILLFTDSLIVLNWIKSPYRKLNTYVSHRLMEIIELTKDNMWNYVNTKSNPADLLTRGVSPQHLQRTTLWWNGPHWVVQEPHTWPNSTPDNDNKNKLELVSVYVSNASKEFASYFYNYFQRHSSFFKLTRVIAYIFRFKNILLKKNPDRQNSYLTTAELKQAHDFIIKVVQYKHYSKEIHELQKDKGNYSSNNILTGTSSIYKSSSLRKLNPFLDQDNIIRLGGRIATSDIPYNHAHPIILPHREHITSLIVEQYHLRLLHSGIQNTLGNLRLKYWPINSRNEVKKVIHRCVRCIRYNARTCEQQMAGLPTPRVSLVRPFLHVGVDFTGAIYIRSSMGRSCKYVKGYICLFVCLSTKALHLELVTDLTSQAFICALKRFTSRRGICQCIYSDNATNFKGAHSELNDLFKMFKNDVSYSHIIEYCNLNAIQWKFTVPLASHMGGLYEAGIKSVKSLLKRHLNNVRLTYELLYTVLVQIEGVLNSRPLCTLKDVPDTEFVCLTPAHFLIGVPISDIPEPNVLNKLENRLNLYQKITQIKQKFWSNFYCNYLSELQTRSKWFHVSANLKIGDIVILKEDNAPPACWPLGKVMSVNKNTKDNLVRSVLIKTCKGEYMRPINKLILLPCN